MGKKIKKVAKAQNFQKKKDDDSEESPFASIVLKEKKEEVNKKPQVKPKKASEVVGGYDPNASFADILANYERTGNPYAMPKKGSQKKGPTSFAEILDKWEGKDKKKEQKKEREKSEYKATKSFGDILSEFEGKPKEEKKEREALIEEEIKEEVSFFKEEGTEDYEKRSPNAAWSIYGNNESFERKVEEVKEEPKEEAKKEEIVVEKKSEYIPTKDFSEILSEFEGSPKKEEKEEKKSEYIPTKDFSEILEEFEEKEVEEVSFFKEEGEDEKRSPEASWSIYGNNESFERKTEEVIEEEPKEEKKEEVVVEEKKSEYIPTKDFGEILSEFEGSSIKEEKEEKKSEYIPTKDFSEILEEFEENKPEEVSFFKEEGEDEKRSPEASWSIYGNNESFERKTEEVIVEEPKEEKKEEEVVVEKKSEYKPTKDFGEILQGFYEEEVKDSESVINEEEKAKEEVKKEKKAAWSVKEAKEAKPYKKEHKGSKKESAKSAEKPKKEIKTFEEIIKEKGDVPEKKEYTISQLRTMMPQSSLDLHGYTQAEAEEEVKKFLEDCRVHGIRKISIITGKGLHSEGGVGVLRDVVIRLLDADGGISERGSAPASYGGDGVLWVILKKTGRP